MNVSFHKRKIDDVPYEACAVFDVNNDGHKDIISGEYWYEGPDFRVKHKICDVRAITEYYDDFSDYPLDVDGDGYSDIITGAWWGETLRWRKNPGRSGDEWAVFDIDVIGSIETIRYLDIDGCGVPEIFPNTPGGPQRIYKLICDEQGRGTGRFAKYEISKGPSGHGLGFADITGNGRIDIVLADGWLEHPENPFTDAWTFHPEFSFGLASVPILGYDVNGDGLCDLIVGQAHNYGLDWWEQGRDAQGKRIWTKHEIDATASQYHDLWLVDIDLDGQPELITGKRWRAHNGNDPGADDPIGLYYFKINGGQFEKHVIDYGPAHQASGAGIYFWVEDITGNGYPDIVAPGKDGLYLFENHGLAKE
ncbi:FG-GAP repeat domain-containing protein [Alicyclobacillus fodiniaquatilis]|uniref:FG-GAP repeat domain-containing protein n=1 Tax=Alicyclobacillus fodiniaquatilis TaxID=1661150 RepID=A0ABW4JM80_9BACL